MVSLLVQSKKLIFLLVIAVSLAIYVGIDRIYFNDKKISLVPPYPNSLEYLILASSKRDVESEKSSSNADAIVWENGIRDREIFLSTTNSFPSQNKFYLQNEDDHIAKKDEQVTFNESTKKKDDVREIRQIVQRQTTQRHSFKQHNEGDDGGGGDRDGGVGVSDDHGGRGVGVAASDGHGDRDDDVGVSDGHGGRDVGVGVSNGHGGRDGGIGVSDDHGGRDVGVAASDGHGDRDGDVGVSDGHGGRDNGVGVSDGHGGRDGGVGVSNGRGGRDNGVGVSDGHGGRDGGVGVSNGRGGRDVGVDISDGYDGRSDGDTDSEIDSDVGVSNDVGGRDGGDKDRGVGVSDGHGGRDGGVGVSDDHDGRDDGVGVSDGRGGRDGGVDISDGYDGRSDGDTDSEIDNDVGVSNDVGDRDGGDRDGGGRDGGGGVNDGDSDPDSNLGASNNGGVSGSDGRGGRSGGIGVSDDGGGRAGRGGGVFVGDGGSNRKVVLGISKSDLGVTDDDTGGRDGVVISDGGTDIDSSIDVVRDGVNSSNVGHDLGNFDDVNSSDAGDGRGSANGDKHIIQDSISQRSNKSSTVQDGTASELSKTETELQQRSFQQNEIDETVVTSQSNSKSKIFSTTNVPSLDTNKANSFREKHSGWTMVEMLDDKGHYFELDDESPCPYLGLRRQRVNYEEDEQVACVTHKPKVEECEEAKAAYHLNNEALRCTEPLGNKICWFLESWRPFPTVRVTPICNISPCGNNPVYVTGIDNRYGILEDKNRWGKFTENKELQRFLVSFVVAHTANGFGYGILSCRAKNSSKTIKQILFFPPVIPRKHQFTNAKLINVNILMLDSVSRAHFYRSLPKTVQTLRNVVHDQDTPATVLDFELLQSMAPYTFHNLRVFMSGKTGFDYKEHEEQTYDINVLYGKLREQGYYTVLQEDSCWFDEWGSFFTNNVFQSNQPKTLKQFEERWVEFKNLTNTYKIDDYGLSHISCEVFSQYNVTNQFNRPKRICYDGRFFASYFLEYNAILFRALEDSRRDTAIFSYTHLNVGHEISGTRIKQIDEDLARYLYAMTTYQNTLTMVFSDHGPKTTRYSFKTMEGRAEIYDPLLFMVVPKGVANMLGADRMHGLITNQKRLLSTLELHNAMISLGDPKRENSNLYYKEGIFAPVPANRTCGDITMKRTAVCKCEGWDRRFPDNHPHFVWVAELALGFLNNDIQRQFLNNMSKPGGFGRCQRLVGFSFEKVRMRTEKVNFTVTMDLIVLPELEIFEIQVSYPRFLGNGRDGSVEVVGHRRVSIYRRFHTCVDKDVSLPSCVCNSNGKKRKHWRKRKVWNYVEIKNGGDVLTTLFRTKNFGAQSEVKNLHDTCLLLITRKPNERTVVVEIANACGDRKYMVKVTGKSAGFFLASSPLPLTTELLPRTIHFLFSVYHIRQPYNFSVKTFFEAHYMK